MNLFNFLKTNVPILQVVGEYTTLRHAGIYWKGICPFHNEKTPSFTVSPHKEIFYCFGCHCSGDVISFVARIENFTQIEAAKFIAERYCINIPKEIDIDFNKTENSINEKEKYFLICQLFAKWCNLELKNDQQSYNYVTKKRLLKEDTIERFSIGYFPAGQNNIKKLLKYLAKEGFLAQDLINASILIQSKTNLFSQFENRIIFPIRDQLGRYCGFGGRIFKENDDRAKYYNSHENSYFSKGSLLYGLELAKKTMQEQGSVFLVEGYTDCITMVQSGYTNCVATLGTACTTDHLKLLSRFIDKIYIMYDGDAAGQNAIIRLTALCWNVNIEIKVICLEKSDDPASFLNKNGNWLEINFKNRGQNK